MDTFSWRSLELIDPDKIRLTRYQLHQAIQNVAAVGRKFLPASAGDEFAALTWIPGLSRLAGQWIKADTTFRSSFSPEAFCVYLVDAKVQELASFPLHGQTHRQLMLWLEEHIGKLGLHAPHLTMNMPYQIPVYPTQQGEPFQLHFPEAATELSRLYHNAYIQLRKFRAARGFTETIIRIWPNHLDEDMKLVIRDTGDPETNTQIALGMCPGDKRFDVPYFYVISWPHVDTHLCNKLTKGIWVSDDWTGAVLLFKDLRAGDQEVIVEQFFNEAYEQLFCLLMN